MSSPKVWALTDALDADEFEGKWFSKGPLVMLMAGTMPSTVPSEVEHPRDGEFPRDLLESFEVSPPRGARYLPCAAHLF